MTLIADAPAFCADVATMPNVFRHGLMQGLFGRSGALRYGDFAVGPGSGVRGVDVAAGRYFLLGSEASDQGGYLVTSIGAADNFNLPAAVGNPYIASVILRVKDAEYGAAAPSTAAIEVFQGTAAASPTALPDSTWESGGPEYEPGAWVRLKDIRVNVADTGAIPGGQFTGGGRHVLRAPATFMGLSTDTYSEAQVGDLRYDIDTGLYAQYNGANWRGISDGRTFCKVQGADAHATTTTKVNSALTFSGRAGRTYVCRYPLRYWGHPSNDMAIDWTGPAGFGIQPFSLSVRSIAQGASSNFDPAYRGVQTSPSGLILGTLGVTSSNVVIALVDVNIVMGGTSGAVTLRIGKNSNVDGATDTTLGEGSSMTAIEAQ